MKNLILALFLFCFSSQFVQAAVPPPLYPLTGFILSSLTTKDMFRLSVGAYTGCSQSDAAGVSSYACSVQGSMVLVHDTLPKFLFTSAVIKTNQKDAKGASLNEYHLHGTYSHSIGQVVFSSPLELYLWEDAANPGIFHGKLLVTNYAVGGGIEARVSREAR